MAVQGLVRLRRHLFGRQATMGTLVDPVRAYPFKGVPSNELNWTDPDIDSGSIDPVAAPYRLAPDLTESLTAPVVYYNDIPLMLSGVFGGGVDGSGSPDVHWAWDPASATVDAIDPWSYQFGDDVETDWFQYSDGVIESLEITGPEGLGALSASMTWRFGSIRSTGSTDSPNSGTVPIPGLTPDVAGVPVYLKDGAIYIADTEAGLGAGQITDALHTFTLRVNQPYDLKRYANGDKSFDVDDYGRQAREIQLECTFAKTTQTVGLLSESDFWMSDKAVNRVVRVAFESTEEADTGTFYSWDFAMPMRYYTRTEGEVGGNTVIVLTGHAFYDADDFGGVFSSDLVNTLADIGAS